MKSIRGRLLLMLMAGLFVALTAGGTSIYWIVRSNLLRQLDEGLSARVRTLASLVSVEDKVVKFDREEAHAETLRGTSYVIRSSVGKVMKRSDVRAENSLPMRMPPHEDLLFEGVAIEGIGGGRVVWLAFQPDHDHDPTEDPHDGEVLADFSQETETIVIAAAVDREPIDRSLATLLAVLMIVGGVVFVTVIVLVIGGVRWGLRPLNQLTEQLKRVSGSSISGKLDNPNIPSELAPVYDELNAMLRRLEETIDRERLFADAAAHELRTPLAELRASAEVAFKWPDIERSTAALEQILVIGTEMERLVESLLLISRSELALKKTDSESPLEPIVRMCLERQVENIQAKRLNVEVNLNGRPSLRSNKTALEIIVRNLIDNAITYTPTDGSITVADGTKTDGSHTFTIENGPVNVTDADLPRLFEPFWRMDTSRTDRSHVGLGLAVVKRVAESGGLHIEAVLAGERLQLRLTQHCAQ